MRHLLLSFLDDARKGIRLGVLDLRNFGRRLVGKPRICWDCQKRLAADGSSLCRECNIDWACT